MTVRYETVGALNRAVANQIGDLGDDSILVDDGSDELLIARPVTEANDE